MKITKIKLRLNINENFTRLAERMSCRTFYLHVTKLNWFFKSNVWCHVNLLWRKKGFLNFDTQDSILVGKFILNITGESCELEKASLSQI